MPRVRKTVVETQTEELPVQAAVQDVRDIPDQPEGKNFWEFMEPIPQEEWEKRGLAVWIYRVEPPAGKIEGEPAYLKKYIRPFSIEEVKNEFGGGKYLYWFRERNKVLARGFFRVGGDPKVAPEPVRGGTVESFLPMMEKMFEKFTEAREHGIDPKTATEQAMSILTTAYQTGLATVAKSSEAPKMTDLIAALADLQKLQGGGQSDFSKMLMDKVVERILNPPDPMEQMSKLLEMQKTLGLDRDAGNDWRVSVAQMVPSALASVKDIMKDFRAAAEENRLAAEHRAAIAWTQRGGPVMPAVAGPTATPPSSVLQSGPPSSPPAHAPFETEPLGAAGTPSASPAAAPAITAPDDTWIKQQIVAQFLEARSGEEIGDWLDHTAPQIVDALAPHSVEELMLFFKSDPVLRLIPDTVRTREQIAEFLSYAKEESLSAPSPPKVN